MRPGISGLLQPLVPHDPVLLRKCFLCTDKTLKISGGAQHCCGVNSNIGKAQSATAGQQPRMPLSAV